jgi:hypothetical protein
VRPAAATVWFPQVDQWEAVKMQAERAQQAGKSAANLERAARRETAGSGSSGGGGGALSASKAVAGGAAAAAAKAAERVKGRGGGGSGGGGGGGSGGFFDDDDDDDDDGGGGDGDGADDGAKQSVGTKLLGGLSAMKAAVGDAAGDQETVEERCTLSLGVAEGVAAVVPARTRLTYEVALCAAGGPVVWEFTVGEHSVGFAAKFHATDDPCSGPIEVSETYAIVTEAPCSASTPGCQSAVSTPTSPQSVVIDQPLWTGLGGGHGVPERGDAQRPLHAGGRWHAAVGARQQLLTADQQVVAAQGDAGGGRRDGSDASPRGPNRRLPG